MELVEDHTKSALEIAEEHDFQIWRAVATCLHGAGLAGMGLQEEGLIEINRGMDLYKDMKTPPVFWPLLLLVQAGACLQAGRHEEGLTVLDKAMEIVGPGSGNPISSELCRLKGDLLIARNPENRAEAEPWFHQAIEIAQNRQARMMELRAALSLYQLCREQGKLEQGQQLLSDSYEKFTEGFKTADLQEARSFLDELS